MRRHLAPAGHQGLDIARAGHDRSGANHHCETTLRAALQGVDFCVGDGGGGARSRVGGTVFHLGFPGQVATWTGAGSRGEQSCAELDGVAQLSIASFTRDALWKTKSIYAQEWSSSRHGVGSPSGAVPSPCCRVGGELGPQDGWIRSVGTLAQTQKAVLPEPVRCPSSAASRL